MEKCYFSELIKEKDKRNILHESTYLKTNYVYYHILLYHNKTLLFKEHAHCKTMHNPSIDLFGNMALKQVFHSLCKTREKQMSDFKNTYLRRQEKGLEQEPNYYLVTLRSRQFLCEG